MNFNPFDHKTQLCNQMIHTDLKVMLVFYKVTFHTKRLCNVIPPLYYEICFTLINSLPIIFNCLLKKMKLKSKERYDI